MSLTDINKIPDAEVIAKRIFDVIKFHELEQDIISKILNEWNEEWIDYIAENKTGMHDGTKRTNDKRLKQRIDRLDSLVSRQGVTDKRLLQDDPGF